MTALRLNLAGKAFPARNGRGPVHALGPLAVEFRDGAFVCLIGPSGCGKTTLLRVVAGLESADVADADIDGAGGAPVGRTVGYAFQSPRLMPWLTVLDNLLLVDRRPGARERAEELLVCMRLDRFATAFPGELSGGMQRRVALARAFMVEPSLLLLDEPFVSQDQPTARELRDLLIELWRERPTTVLMVTHDLREAVTLADRILFLSAAPGRVILDLPVDLSRPRSEAAAGRFVADLAASHPRLLAGLP